MEKILCWSGGKDSTALLIRQVEAGTPRILFADVGPEAEFDETYEFIEKVERLIPIFTRQFREATEKECLGAFLQQRQSAAVTGVR